jgi:hypothetical protein
MGDRDRGGWKEGAAMKRVTDIELEQALVYIRRMRVDNERKLEDARRIIAEHDKYRRETWWFPIVIVVSGMTAGAALLAAGATLTKLEARLKAAANVGAALSVFLRMQALVSVRAGDVTSGPPRTTA